MNSTIAIVGEEGDDFSGADAMAKEAESASSGSSEKKESAKEEKKEDKPEKKEAPPPKEEKKPAQDKSPKSSSDGPIRHAFASPIARRLAQERGVPLLKVKGTGPDGRIVKEDIEKYESSSGSSATAPAASSAPSGASYTDTPLSNMRRTIASRLSESKATIPHYYVSVDVTMDRVLQLRDVFNRASAESARGDADKAKAAKLSVNDFIMKAAAIALKQVPAVNSAWHGDFIRENHVQDISMAVSTPTGLITPIVRNAGSIGLSEISTQSKALAKKARDGKLKPDEYQGGTFTISNMGMMGVAHFTAIINAPQSCILAIGTTEPRMIPDESERGWHKAEVMQVTLSSDHRVADGAVSAQWLKAFKTALENPLSFML